MAAVTTLDRIEGVADRLERVERALTSRGTPRGQDSIRSEFDNFFNVVPRQGISKRGIEDNAEAITDIQAMLMRIEALLQEGRRDDQANEPAIRDRLANLRNIQASLLSGDYDRETMDQMLQRDTRLARAVDYVYNHKGRDQNKQGRMNVPLNLGQQFGNAAKEVAETPLRAVDNVFTAIAKQGEGIFGPLSVLAAPIFGALTKVGNSAERYSVTRRENQDEVDGDIIEDRTLFGRMSNSLSDKLIGTRREEADRREYRETAAIQSQTLQDIYDEVRKGNEEFATFDKQQQVTTQESGSGGLLVPLLAIGGGILSALSGIATSLVSLLAPYFLQLGKMLSRLAGSLVRGLLGFGRAAVRNLLKGVRWLLPRMVNGVGNLIEGLGGGAGALGFFGGGTAIAMAIAEVWKSIKDKQFGGVEGAAAMQEINSKIESEQITNENETRRLHNQGEVLNLWGENADQEAAEAAYGPGANIVGKRTVAEYEQAIINAGRVPITRTNSGNLDEAFQGSAYERQLAEQELVQNQADSRTNSYAQLLPFVKILNDRKYPDQDKYKGVTGTRAGDRRNRIRQPGWFGSYSNAEGLLYDAGYGVDELEDLRLLGDNWYENLIRLQAGEAVETAGGRTVTKDNLRDVIPYERGGAVAYTRTFQNLDKIATSVSNLGLAQLREDPSDVPQELMPQLTNGGSVAPAVVNNTTVNNTTINNIQKDYEYR